MPDISDDDCREFCKAHEVEFFKRGNPDNWDDPLTFRAGTIEYPSRGITILIEKVRDWKKYQPSYLGEGI